MTMERSTGSMTLFYDVENKVLRFSTNHFSIYGAGYREKIIGFTDIENHWAKGDIEFVVRQGLFERYL